VGFISVSPQLSFSNTTTRVDTEEVSHVETRIDRSTNPADTSLVVLPYRRVVDTQNNFRWNTGASASTNIFGTFYPHIGRLRGIQHKISPQVSWSYTPDIGNEGPSRQNVNVSLSQYLNLKVSEGSREKESAARRSDSERAAPGEGEGEKEEEEERLTRLDGVATWNLSSSYNPDPGPRGREWSNVNSRLTVNVLGTSAAMSQTYDPYAGEVTYTSVTSRLTFRGTHPFGKADNITVRELNVVAAADTTRGRDGGGSSYEQTGDVLEGRDELALEEGRLPWSVSMDISFTKSGDSDPRSTLRLNSQFDLTRTWSFTYNTDYDVTERALRGQAYTISRDLHCWEMSFSRQKLGDEWQFYFRIDLKAHPEIYAEQGRRGLGGGTFGSGTLGF
jgi:hypothetical protein